MSDKAKGSKKGTVSEAAKILGSVGGKTITTKKSNQSKVNGKKGGRPKGSSE